MPLPRAAHAQPVTLVMPAAMRLGRRGKHGWGHGDGPYRLMVSLEDVHTNCTRYARNLPYVQAVVDATPEDRRKGTCPETLPSLFGVMYCCLASADIPRQDWCPVLVHFGHCPLPYAARRLRPHQPRDGSSSVPAPCAWSLPHVQVPPPHQALRVMPLTTISYCHPHHAPPSSSPTFRPCVHPDVQLSAMSLPCLPNLPLNTRLLIAAPHPTTHADLVFIQNGMLQPWLDARGLGENTQVRSGSGGGAAGGRALVG